MENFRWKDTVRVNIFVLKLVGLWPRGNGKYRFDFYTLYSAILLLLFMAMHTVVLTGTLFAVYTDLEAVTEVIFMYGLETLLLFKAYCFVRNMSVIKEIMADMKCELFQPKSLEQVALVRPGLKEWTVTYTVFSTSMVSNIFFWTFYPILDGSVKERRLPFLARYPYDFKKSPFYELTYLHQIVSVGLMSVAAINMDMFLGALMTLVGAQCRLLCDNLRNIEGCDFSREFLRCVRHHKTILRYVKLAIWRNCLIVVFCSVVDHFSRFFSLIIMGQLLTSAMSIGLAMFHLTLVS
jgi:hypothetical protein